MGLAGTFPENHRNFLEKKKTDAVQGENKKIKIKITIISQVIQWITTEKLSVFDCFCYQIPGAAKS